ncbi:ATP-binding protein [Amycolatopsis sp. NPDC006131]|uniref:ATP-binding protein n=1 Tax=Amycolatopsis sp. NPDC006131 TaxID=3156731 RepID=UPI0033BD6337
MNPIDDMPPERLLELRSVAKEINPRSLDKVPPRYSAAELTHPQVRAWADQHAAAIATSWPSNKPISMRPSLLIAGPVGTGKTHNSFAAVRYIASLGVPVVFQYVKHADMVAAGRYKSGFSPREHFDRLTKTPLLIIDDLGTADDPDGLTARVIDTRYDNLDATIFTSNFASKQIADMLGERVASRLAETCRVVNLTGDDRRRQ